MFIYYLRKNVTVTWLTFWRWHLISLGGLSRGGLLHTQFARIPNETMPSGKTSTHSYANISRTLHFTRSEKIIVLFRFNKIGEEVMFPLFPLPTTFIEVSELQTTMAIILL